MIKTNRYAFNITKPRLSFCGNNNDLINNDKEIIISHNQIKINKLLNLQNQLNGIMHQLGGNKSSSGILNDIEQAKFKIKKLQIETREAWSNSPEILKAKMNKLENLSTSVAVISDEYELLSDDMSKTKEGIILDKKKIVTDPLEVMASYNKALQNQSLFKNNKIGSKLVKGDFVSAQELEKSIAELDKENWNFTKFNSADSKIYSKLKDNVFVGNEKKLILKQIETIDIKLNELKNNGYKTHEGTNLKVYSPETTGKILALETAKLRREALNQAILAPDTYLNIDNPNILIQPTSTGKPIVFKIDKTFTPTNYELNGVLEQTKPFEKALTRFFPDGLSLYVVPGYSNEKMGDLSGGESIPSDPDAGIWLNSYDFDKKYGYMSVLENTIAKIRGVNEFTPSVISGKEDRARALSHEIGHSIYYKILQNDSDKVSNTKSGFSLMAEPSFSSVWEVLRMNSKQKLNGNDMNTKQFSRLENDDKENLRKFVEYEMLAEDIRIALNGKNIPASSKMSGVYDQSKEGKEDFIKTIDFIKKYILENASPTEFLFDSMYKNPKNQ